MSKKPPNEDEHLDNSRKRERSDSPYLQRENKQHHDEGPSGAKADPAGLKNGVDEDNSDTPGCVRDAQGRETGMPYIDSLDKRIDEKVKRHAKRLLRRWLGVSAATITILGFLGVNNIIPRMLRELESHMEAQLAELAENVEHVNDAAGKSMEMAIEAEKTVNDVNEYVQDVSLEIEAQLERLRAGAEATIEELREETLQTIDELRNGLTVLRQLPASLHPSSVHDVQSAGNANYRVTIYYDRQTEEAFKRCQHILTQAGFIVNGLDKTRARVILDELRWHEDKPRWSLSEVAVNTITATEDAVSRAKRISDLLRGVNIDLGTEVLDWEQFRRRYGDSMLTKAFPNANSLIEIYLFGSEETPKL